MPIQDIFKDTQGDYSEILEKIQSSEKSENNNFIEFLQGLQEANIAGSWNNQTLIITSLDKFSQFPNWQDDCLNVLPLALTEEHKQTIKNKIEKLTQSGPASTISYQTATSSRGAAFL